MSETNVTGYVCARAYVDRSFADRVLDALLWDQRWIAAPCPRLDLEQVARCCLVARRRQLWFLVWLLCAPAAYWLASSVALLAAGRRLSWLLAVCHLALAHLSTVAVPALFSQAARQQGYLTGVPVVLFVLVMVVAVGAGPWVALSALALPTLLSVLVVATHRYQKDVQVARLLSEGHQVPAARVRLSAEVERRLHDLQAQQHGLLTVYPEWCKHPFVDCGARRGQGSFQVPLDAASNPTRPTKDFQVDELVEHLRAGADHLREELPGTRAEHRLYVGHETLAATPAYQELARLPQADVPSLPSPLVEVIRAPQPFARHYLCIRVAAPAWKDQLVFTLAVHFRKDAKEAPTLTIESDEHVYFPLKAGYVLPEEHGRRQVDGGLLALLGQAALDLPRAAASAPAEVVGELRWLAWVLLPHRWGGRRCKPPDPARGDVKVFDLRRYVSASEMAHFQHRDVARYQQLVEEHLLRLLREFLHEHNVDVTSLVKAKTSIFNSVYNINNGIVGSVEAEALAVGQDATVQAPTP